MKVPSCLFVLAFLTAVVAQGDECEQWFLKTKIKPGTDDCLTQCAAASTGMATFMCPFECEKLCKTTLPKHAIDQLTYPPGITEAEKDLIAKHPADALRVYEAKLRAEEATSRYFGLGRANDESDAFRHFVWSAMTTKALGAERARLFLTAHEEFSGNPETEKTMDMANNESGIQTAEKLKEEDKLSQFHVEREAIEKLNKGELSVLTPRGKVPDWRYQ